MEKEYDKTRRKWITQMSKTELTVLTQGVQSFRNWKFSDHALDEMENDNVTMFEVAAVLKQGRVLEVNNVAAYDICVMLRKNIGNRSIAVVVSMVTGKIKTVYCNGLNEDERLPNMSNYKWTANLEGIESVDRNNLAKVK